MKSIAFKNVFVYRLSKEIALDKKTVDEALGRFVFSPCGSQDMASSGWIPVLGSNLTHEGYGYLLMSIQREEKILPTAVIKATLKAKVEKLEEQQGRRLKKTEKDSLKDEVFHALLPRAFSRLYQNRLLIDRNKGLVFVEATSARKSEAMLALLRKTLGSLPVVPFTPAVPVELTITEWLKTGFPQSFSPGEDAVLQALLENGGAVRCKKQDLQSDEVLTHINAGKLATTITLHWQDRATFRLCDDMTIKTLKFCDALYDQNDDIDREDVAQRFDADFILFTSEFSALFSALVEAVGGESQQ